MSALGGSRAGSGRKRLYSSKNSYKEIWRRGYRSIWIDNMIYSSWVSAELKCGYSTDSNFAAHLLSLEMRRRGNNAAFASSTTSWKEDTADDPSSKRQRHFEDEICFPGMFYDLLLKMLALFERLADSCYSTYKWFSQFSGGVKFVVHFSMCVQLELHCTWHNVTCYQLHRCMMFVNKINGNIPW